MQYIIVQGRNLTILTVAVNELLANEGTCVVPLGGVAVIGGQCCQALTVEEFKVPDSRMYISAKEGIRPAKAEDYGVLPEDGDIPLAKDAAILQDDGIPPEEK